MAAKTWRGEWWLPGTPDQRTPGQLVIDDEGNCRLELVGSLDLESEAAKESPQLANTLRGDRVKVIHGASRAKPITLLDCFTTSSDGFSAASRSYQDIHVHEALIGAHVLHEQPVFVDAIVEIENLTRWLNVSDAVERSQEAEGEHAMTRHPPDLTCEMDGWTITARWLPQPFQVQHKRAGLTVEGELAAYLTLTPPEPVASREFRHAVHELTDLITLAAGEASGLIKLTLIHRDPTSMPQADGTVYELSTRVESFGARTHTARPDTPALEEWRFLFTCLDRPFIEVVPDWLQIRRRAPEACNVYFGMRYARPTFTEVRLLMMAITTEALHKALVNPAELSDEDLERFRRESAEAVAGGARMSRLRAAPTFQERAIGLAGLVDVEAIATVAGDLDVWSKRLRTARNNLAHTGNEDDDVDIFQLEWVTSSLISLALMAELGISAEVQQRAARDILRPPR